MRIYRRQSGPKRSRSLQSSLRQTRALAGVAGLALVAGIVSDVSAAHFWNRHSLITGLVSSFIVVMITVAVVNEVAEWRSRRRWSVLAQYVMIQLVRHARMIWMEMAQLAGVLSASADWGTSLDTGARAARDRALLRSAIGDLVADRGRRRELQDVIARLVDYSDHVVARWVGVMLNTPAYAEVIDRHVELASTLAWLQGLLDNFEPPDDQVRWRRARAHPAGQFEGQLEDEVLIQRIVVIVQLAEGLDNATLQLAEQLVPREWWSRASRLPTPDQERRSETQPSGG